MDISKLDFGMFEKPEKQEILKVCKNCEYFRFYNMFICIKLNSKVKRMSHCKNWQRKKSDFEKV